MAGGHSHSSSHGRHDHAHGANERSTGLAALLTGGFMIAEVIGGLASGSLALLADAGHMLTDFAALALAWFGFRLARRPASWKRTYGFDRFSVLVAFASGLSLFVIAGWIVVEAWQRLAEPVEVLGNLMLWVALAGLSVNVLALAILRSGDRGNLNIRAAALHVVGDLLASVAAICASLVIIATGWMPIDPILSVLVSLIILRSAFKVVRESGHILLEGSPRGVDVREIVDDLERGLDEVERVHHVHAWCITQERPMITLHARVRPGTDAAAAIAAIRRRVEGKFGIAHSTIEIEQAERPHADRPS